MFDAARDTSAARHRRFCRSALLAILLVGAASAALFLSYPSLDLIIARALEREPGPFMLSGHPVAQGFNDGIEILLKVTCGLLIVALAIIWWRRRRLLALERRMIVFVLLGFVIGPGLVTNAIFKDNWGRARPSQIAEFGGERSFTPAFVITDQCHKNCSFVSGDASVAFGYLSLALLLKRRRALAIGGALVFGAGIGAIRMMQGAHFASDVVFAGVFTWLVVIALYWLLLGPSGLRLPAGLGRRLPWLQRALGPSPGW